MTLRRCQKCDSILSVYNKHRVCFRHLEHPDFQLYFDQPHFHDITTCSSPRNIGLEQVFFDYYGFRNG